MKQIKTRTEISHQAIDEQIGSDDSWATYLTDKTENENN